MKAIFDPQHALAQGLSEIRQQFQLPTEFPPDVLAAAHAAAQRTPTDHIDRSGMAFVTLDPATSTDLDQAFAIERLGVDLLLHYAIADVAWFVDDGDPVDAEAWRRGTSQYLPDGKASLYPAILSENAASLLPTGPRPAVIFSVRVGPDGAVRLDGVERAIIRSRAKLAYATVRETDLPDGFAELAARIAEAEENRGAARVDPPEQEVERDGDGRFHLQFRPRLRSEDHNAALSLATNMAVADALQAHHTGLFRVMPEPDEQAIARLRQTARAFGIDWPGQMTLTHFERGLDPDQPKHAALMLAIRRAGERAAYQPYREGSRPWHAAVSATYAHATAPLRRLADRYVIRAALAVSNGKPVPEEVSDAFERLPDVMTQADRLGGSIERAVVDLAEAVVLQGQEGRVFDAVVTDADDRGARIQLCDLPVVARLRTQGVMPGDDVRVQLTQADTEKRVIRFEPEGEGPVVAKQDI